jgi:peptidoglycan pentaglycine glycine transferase (the first glycine)
MTIELAHDQRTWDDFLAGEPWSPFLQSFAIGNVYKKLSQDIVRLQVIEDEKIVGIVFGHVVPARRGRHVAVPYGPVVHSTLPYQKRKEIAKMLIKGLHDRARQERCSFIRVSPWQEGGKDVLITGIPSPLHLLAEHIWYIDLRGHTEDELLSQMRKTTRNLIRRAEKDGVTVEASKNPNADLEHFLRLHEETRKRHHFTPYREEFFRAEVEEFAKDGHCTIYLARHEERVIATSIHIHMHGETSYHHGASEQSKVPASYLLQWTAIKDAMKRGDRIYNFWGIAPTNPTRSAHVEGEAKEKGHKKNHPFAGVTLFKTGFGGTLMNLQHCHDIPLSLGYYGTFLFEIVRRWRRGF